jgi:hypothetical protein
MFPAMQAPRQTTLPGASPVATAAEGADAKAVQKAKAARGELTHGRQKEIQRQANGILNLVHNWENRAVVSAKTIAQMKYSQRDLITANMIPILHALKTPQHLNTVKGQFRGYFEMAASEPVRCYEENGKAIDTLLEQSVGGMAPKELKQTVNDSTLGKLNKYVGMLRTFVTEEMDEKLSGSEIIHDRMAFAGANWKPLVQLRDAWAAEASTWINQATQLKRAYDHEQAAAKAAAERAEVLAARGAGGGNGDEPPPKRMKVRSAQVAKPQYPGSLTVDPGMQCIFIESTTNPLWSRVRMDDGRIGLVSASRLEVLEEEPPLPDPSDDDELLPDPSDDEDDEDSLGPSLDLVKAEVARIFEDMEEFSIEDFMENQAFSRYKEAQVVDALAAVAAMESPILIIDEGYYPPYQRPPAL